MLLSNFQITTVTVELWIQIALHDRRLIIGEEQRGEYELALSSAACWQASSADTEFARWTEMSFFDQLLNIKIGLEKKPNIWSTIDKMRSTTSNVMTCVQCSMFLMFCKP